MNLGSFVVWLLIVGGRGGGGGTAAGGLASPSSPSPFAQTAEGENGMERG